ncbi:DUF3794 domain-containing protein [Sporohalobacter salinus]|uniref:DUF3794 domain-containing protein n=1 Tax=Sporohalobacter salinus TaxID=1494606 RepID=UPI001961074B|nr:DUF3794 domain-containing protein [Sporohalobacter salinus]MBM7625128.1 hypothetical protein [Sporohalobacter salinus]
MANKLKNLIEYEGIADSLPEFTDPINPIKELTIDRRCTVPDAKPDIEQILKIESELEIIETNVIQTPTATSLEEQNLTGWKLTIEAEIKQKIQYVANEPTQSVHAMHCNLPFSAFIILPDDFMEGQDVFVEGFIEDIFALQTDLRSFFENVTLLLVAEVC